MVKDEDTTPVALRAALLRDGKTRVRAKATKSSILWRLGLCICVASLAWHLSTFENAADLRFFGGIGVALDLWLAVHAVNATVLELPCAHISAVYDAHQPIIFRSCIPEGVGLADIGYFPNEKQNLFTPCDEKLIRDFEFVDVSNNTKVIVEQVPCSPSTLQDKIDAFDAHDIRRHGRPSRAVWHRVEKQSKSQVTLVEQRLQTAARLVGYRSQFERALCQLVVVDKPSPQRAKSQT